MSGRDPREERGRLTLDVHARVVFVLVGAHYPENVGAAARAIKTMGFRRLVLVKPGRLAAPDSEMARKMAVKALDVLEGARVVPTLDAALGAATLVVATTARRGVSGVLSPRAAAELVLAESARGGEICVLFGNEKTGLTERDLQLCHERLRVPMAADQPSINLAQSVQLVAWELFELALERR